MKRTNEEGTERGMDCARERGGRKRAEEGLSEEGREQEVGGAREGGKLQGRYPEKGTGQCTVSVYYKRRRLYLCSAKDPVLHGSGSRRVYRRKGTSFDRVYVCL